jgi:predicted Zn-dependent protease
MKPASYLGLLALLLVTLSAVSQPSAQLEQTSQRARQLLDQEKFAEAIPLLLELREAAPNNTSLGMTLGQAYAATGDYQKAILEFDSVRRRLPQFKPAIVSLATLYLNLGQSREGISLLSGFVGRNPGDTDARSLLASAYAAQGDLVRANEQLREIAAAESKNPQVWYQLTQNYRDLAAESMYLAEQADPESAPMVAIAGMERLELGQNESAFFLLREAQRRNPKLRGLHSMIAGIYRATEREEWAKQEEARERALGDPDCTREAAACAVLQGKPLDALRETRFARLPEDLYWRYQAARELQEEAYRTLQALPASVQSHGARAERAKKAGRHPEAVAAWRAALAVAPENPGLEKELAVSLYQARDFEDCAKTTDRLLKVAPNDPEVLLLRGDAALEQQKAAEALPFLQRALQAQPDMAPAHASIGRVLMQLEKPAEALPHLEKALPYAPDGAVLYLYAQALQRTGKAEQAKQALVQYQQVLRKEQQEKAEFEKRFQITAP